MQNVEHEAGLVDLGDARIETRGVDPEGPLDFQTGLRKIGGGIQAAD
ncbi:hypothetical protein EEB18_012055 [Sphingopyxis sp. OPL5]|nr:hypothetical protein [Sphingopyxis sp. OPL5]QNO25540.1 hypothetical protein EEB18_012055 [Sphingopyxis sp. OPL5]